MTAIPAAVSDECGIAAFQIAKRGRASNALKAAGGNSQMGGVRETHHVPTLTMETLLDHSPAPSFIKIDVEGAEVMALKGAQKILTDVRPIIYCEVNVANFQDVKYYLSGFDYKVMDQNKKEASPESGANLYLVPS